MTKARTSSKRKGRPRKDAIRTESGRISRSISQLEREAVSWKRQRDNPGVEPEMLRLQEYGSVIHKWREMGASAEKIAEKTGKAPGFVFTANQLWTAESLHKLHDAYLIAIAAKTPRSSTDFGGPGGYDGRDPFAPEQARPDYSAISRWDAARRKILEAGPLCMMAVEAILFENKDCIELLPDFRLALNAVDRLWRIAKAA